MRFELVEPWDKNDEAMVLAELEKLYMLQDRPLNDDKKAVLLLELARAGLPAAAVIVGIKQLQCEDLKQVKISTILQASRSMIIDKAEVPCGECRRSGYAVLRDQQGRNFALACICENGTRWRGGKDGLVQWEGESSQGVGSRVLTRPL